jgi:hypothetical protein
MPHNRIRKRRTEFSCLPQLETELGGYATMEYGRSKDFGDILIPHRQVRSDTAYLAYFAAFEQAT